MSGFSHSPDALRSELEQALLVLAELSATVSAESCDVGVQEHVVEEEEEDQADMAPKHWDDEEANVGGLHEENAKLREELEQFKHALKQEELKSATSANTLQELQTISGRLQSEVLDMDREKIRLLDIVKKTQEENEVLGKVMEKISMDYDELKQLHEQLQQPQLAKDDKIKALRNTARALENENVLLLRERENLEKEVYVQKCRAAERQKEMQARLDGAASKQQDLENEISAKDRERELFLERFDRLEKEKLNVMRQLALVEQELDVCRADLKKMDEERSVLQSDRLTTDQLMEALRLGKLSAELKLQEAVADKSELSEQMVASQSRTATLQEAMEQLKQDFTVKLNAMNALEEKLVQQESLYEARIHEMQQELSLRLEEINKNRDEEVEVVKERYVKLFNEKVEELHEVQKQNAEHVELAKEDKRRILDLEYREEEMQNLLNKTQASMEDKLRGSTDEVKLEMERLQEHTGRVEEELASMKKQYDCLQGSYRNSVSLLQDRLCDITGILRAQKEQEEEDKRRGEEGEKTCTNDICHDNTATATAEVPDLDLTLSSHLKTNGQESCCSSEKEEKVGGSKRKRAKKKHRKKLACRT